MTKTQYAGYLKSPHWKNLRTEMLAEISECERCSLPRWLAELLYDQDLHLHHLNYSNLGNEKVEDLEILCRRCHEVETFGRSELKEPKTSTCEMCGSTHWDYRSELCPTCYRIDETPHIMYIRDRFRPGSEETVRTYLLHLLGVEPNIVLVLDSIYQEAKKIAFDAPLSDDDIAF